MAFEALLDSQLARPFINLVSNITPGGFCNLLYFFKTARDQLWPI